MQFKKSIEDASELEDYFSGMKSERRKNFRINAFKYFRQ